MVDFKLFGGPRNGLIVAIDNPFLIETQIVPRGSQDGIVFDRYTRRDLDGIFFYVHESLSDGDAHKMLRTFDVDDLNAFLKGGNKS